MMRSTRSRRRMNLFSIGLATTIAGGLVSTAVQAQLPESVYNPHPTNEDLVLPLPGAYKMEFVRVPVLGKGYWGTSERIFEIGSDKLKPEPFEAPRTARIGGNFKTPAGKWFLVIGKYEVTIGQYAALYGDGDIARGLSFLADNSAIEQPKKNEAADAAAVNPRMLARPLHGLNPYDYQEFIAKYNAWCLSNAECLDVMRRELGAVGFFRLP